MASVLENLKGLLEERGRLWETTGKPLADIAAERALTGEEEQSFTRAEESFREYDSRIKALEMTLEQERVVSKFADELRGDIDAVVAGFRRELRSVIVDREKSLGYVDFTGPQFTRALAIGTPAAGGATTSPEFLNELVVGLRNLSSVLQAGARVIVTNTGNDIPIPTLASFGQAAQVAEAQVTPEGDPTFSTQTLKSFKLGQFLGISRELTEDSAVDIESLVVQLISDNIGLLLGSRLAVGTGVNQTLGIMTAATVGKTATAAGGSFGFDDLIDLHYSVAAPYRVKGAWLASDMSLAAVRKLKDNDGQYLWQPSVQVGQPDLILGRPVYADASIAAPAINARPIGFGDVSRYWVRVVNSLRVERSEHALFGSDQIAFRGILRADGKLVDASAFKALKGAAA